MRAYLVAALLLASAAPASAAMIWSETTVNGAPVVAWSRGANLNEVNAAARAFAGQPVRVLESCRQDGWFAYVGSLEQTTYGVSCGYRTREAAIFRARQMCELEGGRCDLERLGHDDGIALGTPPKSVELPNSLTGSTAAVGYVRSPIGPVEVQ